MAVVKKMRLLKEDSSAGNEMKTFENLKAPNVRERQTAKNIKVVNDFVEDWLTQTRFHRTEVAEQDEEEFSSAKDIGDLQDLNEPGERTEDYKVPRSLLSFHFKILH